MEMDSGPPWGKVATDLGEEAEHRAGDVVVLYPSELLADGAPVRVP